MQKISFCERYMLTTAVLNRTKELTRRLEKAIERAVENYKKKYGEEPVIKYQEWVKEGNFLRAHCEHGLLSFQPRYILGEVVAVAQSYKDLGYTKEWVERHISPNPNAKWNDPFEKIYPGWFNKMFVPAELNKAHQIQITGVRIERLQAISDEDVYKEGFKQVAINNNWGNAAWHWEAVLVYYDRLGRTKTIQDRNPREAFAALINRPGVGRKGLWESNPWVICYSFKLVK